MISVAGIHHGESDAGASGVHSIFAVADNWAGCIGAATAVSAPDGVIDFRGLADSTRSLAGRLAAEGVGRNTPVGLFLGRSRLSLSSLLAVWWLGATAVPMDDRHPADRLSFALRDADVRTILADRLPPGTLPRGARRIGATGVAATGAAATGVVTPPRARPEPDDRAYIVYTSGTTGWPKGVEVTYRNLGAFVGALGALGLRPGGMGINAVSPAFDGWLWCALLYLLHGQGMAVVDLAAPETTIAASWSDTARGDDLATIGRPLPGYLAYLLDDDQRPVGAGTAAELYLGGPAVACGYRNRPDLTAERFLPDPFAGGGARMYRTGDVVRARPDGQLEFLGRRDEQVKIAGLRVELGEVERVAAGSAGVRAAAAFVTATGTLGLAVVTTPGAGDGDRPGQVRAHCASRLPEAMVPTVVDVVRALPTLPTGKVDRNALARATVSAATGREPGSERERQVCQVFGDLLSRPVRDVDANFFQLGGHSLLAARAVAVLRRSTGLRLSIRHLLTNPTAAGLAAELGRLDRQDRLPAGGR